MNIKNNFAVWDYHGVSTSIERGVYAFENGFYSLSMSLLKDFAEYGDVHSQFFVGEMFYKGLHVEKNTELGVEWFYHSAIEGEDRLTKFIQMHGEKFNLGWNYQGIEQETFIRQQLKLHNTELVDFLLNVKGDINAQYKLGWMYENGQVVTQDFEQAVKWYTLAAEQGYDSAQSNLGCMYESGQVETQDFEQAVKWYTLAAEQGLANAQYNLGRMYADGRGVIQDLEQAVKWYTLAAEQGRANAQYNLGRMYADGRGVIQDLEQAFKWFTLAAKQDDKYAQYYLGEMYYNGFGVLQDNIYALMWFNLASSNGCIEAPEKRDIVAERMTKKQIEKAQELARECAAKEYKDC